MKRVLSAFASAMVVATGAASAAIINGDLEDAETGYVVFSSSGTVTFEAGAVTLATGDGVEAFAAGVGQGDDGSFTFTVPSLVVPDDAISLVFDLVDVDRTDAAPGEGGSSIFGDAISLSVFQADAPFGDAFGEIIEFGFDLTTYALDVSAFAGTQIAFFLDLFDEDDGFDTSFTVDNFAFVLDDGPGDPIPLPGAFGFALVGFASLYLRGRRA